MICRGDADINRRSAFPTSGLFKIARHVTIRQQESIMAEMEDLKETVKSLKDRIIAIRDSL